MWGYLTGFRSEAPQFQLRKRIFVSGGKILVVEPNTTHLHTLAEQELSADGVEVLVAHTSSEGLNIARRHPLQLALLFLPVEDATALLQNLQQQTAVPPPAILVAARKPDNVPLELVQLGLRGFLAYPCTPQALREAVQPLLPLSLSLPSPTVELTHLLENRLRKTDTLLKIGRLINPLLDANQVLIRATEAAVYLTGAEEGYLLLVDPKTNTLYLRAAQHFGERKAQNYHLPIADSVANTVVQTGKPVLLGRSNGQKYKIQTGHLAKSLLNVPLIARGEVIGVLGVDNQLSDAVFTEMHLRQLTTLADMTAAALASAHQQTELRQALVRRTKELATLQTIAEQLGETSEFELGARLTLALIVQTTGAEAALLAWYPSETAGTPNYISYGSFTEFSLDARPEARHRRRKWWDEEILHGVLASGEPVHEYDLHQSTPADRLGPSRSRLIVPLRLQKQVVGAINLESSLPNAFSDEDRRFVTIIGNQIVIALKARLQQQKAMVQQSSLLPVLQTVNNAIWFVDTDLRLRLQNDAARELLGWPSSEVLGQYICDLVSPHNDAASKLCSLIREAISRRWSLPFPPNMTLTTSSNISLPVGGRVTPVMQGNKVTGVVCAFWERSPGQSSKKLEHEFANMASHLLRTPLSFIQTAIDLMEGSDIAPEEQQVLLNKMRQQIGQLTEFTNELLKMLNLDREDAKINLQPTEVLPLIEQTLKVVDIKDPRYTFTIVPPSADPLPKIAADPIKTELALLNLLLNSVKRSPDGCHITITPHAGAREVRIIIQDNGPDMPLPVQEKLFDPFYAVHDEGGKMPSTYQFGLYTTRRFIEMQGGRIWVKNMSGQGMQFGFSLPIWESKS